MEDTFVRPGEVQGATEEQVKFVRPMPEGEQRQWSPAQHWDEQQEASESPQEPVQDDPEAKTVEDPYQGFSPEIRRDVEGLTHLGHLEEDFSIAGHRFTVKTLHPDEEFAAALAVQPFRGSLKEPEAWITAQVAMALKSVDGDQDFCPPIGPDVNDYAKARLAYVSSKWFYPLIEWIYYDYYGPLVLRAINALKAIENLSKRNRSAFSPASGSLTK